MVTSGDAQNTFKCVSLVLVKVIRNKRFYKLSLKSNIFAVIVEMI